MAERVASKPSLPEGPAHALAQLAERFGAIATCVDGRRGDAAVSTAIEEAAACCQAATEGRGDEVRALLTNLTTALQTWREVWPRMGKQSEFRLAVAREAGLWSKRLQEHARQTQGI